MIMFQRTVTVKASKGEAAMMWAAQVTQYINDTYDLGASFHVGLFGDVGNILWIIHYENFSHYEEVTAALPQDQDYQALLKSAWDQEWLVDGSVNDRVFRTP